MNISKVKGKKIKIVVLKVHSLNWIKTESTGTQGYLNHNTSFKTLPTFIFSKPNGH